MEAITTTGAADLEVIIVGGSYAGLSAAMALEDRCAGYW